MAYRQGWISIRAALLRMGIGAWLMAVAPGCAPRNVVPASPERPNVLLIMADDLGFSDIAPYGGEMDTPALDRLAREGVRFTQFYNTARCSPTRASLMTGLYSHQAGLGHMPDAYARRIREAMDSPAYSDHLAYNTPTMAELLRMAGYATYMSGKWHIGYERPQWPVDRGFDRSFALIPGAMNYWGYNYEAEGEPVPLKMVRDGELYEPPREGFFATDAFSDQAARFIRDHDDKRPFFLYLAFNAPHWPLQAPEQDIRKHRGSYLRKGWDRIRQERYDRLVGMGMIDPRWALAPRPDEVPAWDETPSDERDRWDDEMAVYRAQVERMDAGIGRVLAALAEKGLEENTLVLFLSDNGGAAEDPNRSRAGAVLGSPESYEGYGIRGAHVSSAPFRRTKKWVHEGGIASPFIVRWPSAVGNPGSIRRRPAHLIDIMPTVLELAGASIPRTWAGAPTVPLEGISLRGTFATDEARPRRIFWEHEGNRAVRDGRWKLVSEFPGAWELYDMEWDRTELHDLSKERPEIVRRLSGLYDEWAGRTGVLPWERTTSENR